LGERARVIRLEGRTALVRTDGGEERRVDLRRVLKAGPRKASHPVTTGDLAEIEEGARDAWTIRSVLPRRNLLARVEPGRTGRCHMIAANLDQLLCIQSFRDPPLNIRSIDRFLLLAHTAEARGILIVNKLDLRTGPPPPELAYYPSIGIPVIETSARTGEGIEAVRDVLSRRVTVLIGSSGVGKTSLLNTLIPGLHLRTRPVSKGTSKGVHTTVRVEWIDLPDCGVVLDTPGLRSIVPWGIRAAELLDAFPELRDAAGTCRFPDCRHHREPDCAVRAAVAQGRIPAFRYDSYFRILGTLLEIEEGRHS
jgi:ribosome biogenesis GTPase / thiamine phosphate phosphatase